jgi:undecaprenol kinase
MSISLQKLFKSVKAAWQGLRQSYAKEQNFRIELFALFLVCLFGLFFKIKTLEWAWVLLSAFIVLVAELLNTAIERLTDLVTEKRRTGLARQAKDVAAAAVLLTVFQALIAGLYIFIPKIWRVFKPF